MEGETLQAKIAEKQVEADALREELERVRHEVDSYQSMLKAEGVSKNSCFAPATMQSARGLNDTVQPEFRSFLQWIVCSINLCRHQMFRCSPDQQTIQVGDRDLVLKEMVAWELCPREGLNICVPHELQHEIFTLLSESQARGEFLESDIQHLANDWELVVADFITRPGVDEPAKILVHRRTSQAIFCSRWPADVFATPEKSQPLQTQKEPFDFVKHLCKPDVERLKPELWFEYQGKFWHPSHGEKHILINFDAGLSRWTALGYTEDVSISHDGDHIVMTDRQTKFVGNVDVDGVLRGEAFQDGTGGGHFEFAPAPVGTYSAVVEAKQVEVKFGENWFSGVLQAVQGGIAYVKCDVDMPGVLTVTPITQIRPALILPSTEDDFPDCQDGCAKQVSE